MPYYEAGVFGTRAVRFGSRNNSVFLQNMKHSIKDWFEATRFWSFPVSAMPVIVTFAYLLYNGMVPSGAKPLICFILALIGVIIFHSAGNVLSDYFDYRTGVDCPEAYAVPNLVFDKFKPEEYLRFSIILFAAGCCIGLVLTALAGWKLLIIGGIGFILTAGYSFLKYHALGDLNIFLIFSVLIILGTTVTVTGEFSFDALVLAIPIGIITVSVLHANNTRDIETDRKAGMKSFAMILGGDVSATLYEVYMVIPFVAVILAVIFGWLSPFALFCLPAAIPAWKNLKAASQYNEIGTEAVAGLDQATAKLQLAFSGLLSLGLFIAAIF